jgi:hypothetical protein
MDRWNLLKPREKKILWHIVVLGEKRFTVAANIGLSRAMICNTMGTLYRLLGVRDYVELAFLMGRNYESIEMDAVTLGFEMPGRVMEEVHR